jgi:hypothetical protein
VHDVLCSLCERALQAALLLSFPVLQSLNTLDAALAAAFHVIFFAITYNLINKNPILRMRIG